MRNAQIGNFVCYSNGDGVRKWFNRLMWHCTSDSECTSTLTKLLHFFTSKFRIIQKKAEKIAKNIQPWRDDAKTKGSGALTRLEKVVTIDDMEVYSMSSSVVTPNHVPFHGIATNTSDDGVGGEGGKVKSNLSTSTASLRPADLWKPTQSQMLHEKYPLDEVFRSKYRLKQVLGEGSFGFVWVAERQRDFQEVAVKFILKSKVPDSSWTFNAELGRVPLEVHITKEITHPNIIQFLDYFSDEKFVYLVTELHGTSWTWPNSRIDPLKNKGLRAPGQLLQLSHNSAKDCSGVPGLTRRSPCDLFECIEAHVKLPDDVIRKIFIQVLSAVYFLHGQGYVHRDIKDENIVIDENYDIKLVDFGSAAKIPGRNRGGSDSVGKKRVEDGYYDKFTGTLAFAAPEVLRGLRYGPLEAEVWSLGILLYTLHFKKSPFGSTSSILHSHLELPYESSPGIYDLLRKLLQKDPSKRLPLFEITNHPFLLTNL